MSERHRIEQAARRAKEMARMSDSQLVEAYVATLTSVQNINFSPYLVTAVREAGLWERLTLALVARSRAKEAT